jgi:hypothetical protein
MVYTPQAVILSNGDACHPGDSVVYDDTISNRTYRRIGRVIEIVQIIGSAAEIAGKADFVLVSRAIVGDAHDAYCMRRVEDLGEVQCLNIAVSII